jgi:hypothetical protein
MAAAGDYQNPDHSHDQISLAEPGDSVEQRSIQEILALDGRALHSLAALVEEVRTEMKSNPDYEGDLDSLGEGISQALVQFASEVWESFHGDEQEGDGEHDYDQQ